MIVHETLAEIYGCTRLLDDGETLKRIAREAVVSEGATVVGASEVHYVPHGLTIALFLAESHIILTTWPELDLLLVDVMLCNPAMDCCRVLDRIQEAVAPQGSRIDHHVPRALAHAPSASIARPHVAEAAAVRERG